MDRPTATENAPGQALETKRPPFMVKLGLLPPYTLEDIDAAYRERAKEAHPDRGGSREEFHELKDAVDCAREYVKIRQGRRQWLAANIDRYVQEEQLAAELRRRGAQAEFEQIDWMKQSLGDFAVVTERLYSVRAPGLADGDAFVGFLAEQKSALGGLLELDLAGSRLSDEGVARLGTLKGLRRLNLFGTGVTAAGLDVLAQLPDLERLTLSRNALGWWARRRLGRKFPRVDVVTLD